MKMICLLFLFLGPVVALAQRDAKGEFSKHADIGSPQKTGDAQYNNLTQSYTLKGAGYNIWFNRDEFQYAWKKLSGDFILTANFAFIGQGANAHRKIGWMIRESDEADAAHISAVLHGDGLTVLQWRLLKGANMRDPEDEIFFPGKNVQTIQLERSGKNITMRVAHPGESLQTVGVKEMPDMPDTVLAGLFICSHDTSVVEEARVWNVQVRKP
jgi:hypothetical protein